MAIAPFVVLIPLAGIIAAVYLVIVMRRRRE
jgi:hypothetical protein